MESLWLVIVGGVIGVAGGVIGPLALYWNQSKDEERRRLAEKFEALVSAVYEHDHWLDAVKDHLLFFGDEPRAIPPIRKVEALSAVYFPALVPSVTLFGNGSRQFHQWILGRKAALLDNPNADRTLGHVDAYRAYAAQREGLLDELRDYARNHFISPGRASQ